METVASGSVPGLALKEMLRRLVGRRADVPVLSLYLDLDPSAVPTTRDRSTAISALIDTAHKRVERHDADEHGKASLRADLARARSFLEEHWSPNGARGAAVFSATQARLFQGFALPRPTRSRIVIADTPYVTPLFGAADTRDWLIVCTDARHARFMHGNTERVDEFDLVEDDVAGRHLERAANEVDELVRAAGFEHVLVGGPPEIAPRLEALLGAAARDRLAGRFAVEVTGTTTYAVREAALPCFEERERLHERALLDRLSARLGIGERAVAGRADVAAMLERQRVAALLFAVRDEVDGIEPLIEQAVAQSADICPVRHHPEELDEHGHVAALLRC